MHIAKIHTCIIKRVWVANTKRLRMLMTTVRFCKSKRRTIEKRTFSTRKCNHKYKIKCKFSYKNSDDFFLFPVEINIGERSFSYIFRLN